MDSKSRVCFEGAYGFLLGYSKGLILNKNWDGLKQGFDT